MDRYRFCRAWLVLVLLCLSPLTHSCGSGEDSPETLSVVSASLEFDESGWIYFRETEAKEVGGLTVEGWAIRSGTPKDMAVGEEDADPEAEPELVPTTEVRVMGDGWRVIAEGELSVDLYAIPAKEELEEKVGEEITLSREIFHINFRSVARGAAPFADEEAQQLFYALGERLEEEDPETVREIEGLRDEAEVQPSSTNPDKVLASGPRKLANKLPGSGGGISVPKLAVPSGPQIPVACGEGEVDQQTWECGGHGGGGESTGFAILGRGRQIVALEIAATLAAVTAGLACGGAVGSGFLLAGSCVAALIALAEATAALLCEGGVNVPAIHKAVVPGACTCKAEFPGSAHEMNLIRKPHGSLISRCIGCPEGTSWSVDKQACTCADNNRKPIEVCCANDDEDVYNRTAVCPDNRVCQVVKSTIKNTNGKAFHKEAKGSCVEFAAQSSDAEECKVLATEGLFLVSSFMPRLPEFVSPANIVVDACQSGADYFACDDLGQMVGGGDDYEAFITGQKENANEGAVYTYRSDKGELVEHVTRGGYGDPTAVRAPGSEIYVSESGFFNTPESAWWIETEGGKIGWCKCFETGQCDPEAD